MDMASALKAVADKQISAEAYREALEYLVDHRAELKHRVFIILPGGMRGNTDPAWDKVKAGSAERCSCGNERVIEPSSPRTTYEAGTTVTIKPGEKVYLRPVGGDRESAYVQFRNDIELAALTYLMDPFSSVINFNSLFQTNGWKLEGLAGTAGPHAIIKMGKTEENRIPIVRIASVDLAAKTVTIELDKDVESFDPDKEKPRHE